MRKPIFLALGFLSLVSLFLHLRLNIPVTAQAPDAVATVPLYLPLIQIANKGSDVAPTPVPVEPRCSTAQTVPLLPGSGGQLGNITVGNGQTTLSVTYQANSPWMLYATNLAVAKILSGIPVTLMGNPQVDQFPYHTMHNSLASYTYAIPLSSLGATAGDTLHIAAHTDVKKALAETSDGAWGEGVEFVPGQRGLGMYFTYTVRACNQPPVADNDSYSVHEGATLNVPAPGVLDGDIDPDNNPLTAVLVSTPAHAAAFTLNADGSFSYTHDGSETTSDSFTYKANDEQVSNIATVSLTITPADDPPVAVGDTATVVEDAPVTPIDVLANDTDSDGGPKTIASVTQPSNGTVVIAGGGAGLSYQPNANDCNKPPGTTLDTFTYTLSPGGSTAAVMITVTCVDDFPTAVNDAAAVAPGAPATTINVPANDTDVDGGPINISIVSQPANGVVVITNGGADLTYQPNAGYCNDPPGTSLDTFTYTLTPGSSTATVTVSVICSDTPPTGVNDAATVAEDAPATTLDVLANDTDGDGGPKAITAVTQPANGVVVITNSGADLTYQPNANDCNNPPGTTPDTFTYTLTPGGSTATVTVTVTCVNDLPVAVNDTATVAQNAPATTLDVLANDSDVENDLFTIATVTQPANGTVVNHSTNLTYQPNANYCNTNVGGTPDTFSYTLTPGGATATVSVTVTCPDIPPVAVADTQTVAEDNPATTINVLANDSNSDGGPMSISALTQPANGVVVITNSGADLTYQPNANYCNNPPGTTLDTFTYTLTPGGSATTVAVTVTCANDAPVNTVSAAQTVNEDTNLIFSTANSNAISIADLDAGSGAVKLSLDVANGTLTLAATAGLTFVDGTANGQASVHVTGSLANINTALNGLIYRGAANYNTTRGAETLTIVTNDQGNTGTPGALSDSDTVGITVNAVNDTPTAQAKIFAVQTNMKITGLSGLLTGATDPDTGDGGYTASFTVNDLILLSCTGGTISNINMAVGAFDFDPPPGSTSPCTLQYRVTDNGNPGPGATSPYATITINITGPVIWFVNPAAGVNGDGRLSSPFNNLTSAIGVDAANHRIFLYTGTATVGITLNTGEWLIGQGVTGTDFDTLMGITPPSGTLARPSINGTRPTVQGQVTMAGSSVVRGLNITPAASTVGISASSATGLTVGEASVNTSNAIAVNLVNSDGTFSFSRVDANGGGNGIVWNNAVAATGSFTVIGDGANTAVGGNSSGGVITNMNGADGTTSGIGVYLNNVRNVTLRRMTINGVNTNYAIRGNQVVNFALEYATIAGTNGNNAIVDEDSIRFTELTGAASVLRTTISGGLENNVAVINTAGTLNRIVFDTVTIGANHASLGNDGILLETLTTSVINATVQNSTFTAAAGDLFQFVQNGSASTDLVFTNNTLSNNHPTIATGGGGVSIAGGSSGTLTLNMTGNTFRDAVGIGVLIVKPTGNSTLSGVFANNSIGVAAVANSGSAEGSGLKIQSVGQGTLTMAVTGNAIHQYNNFGIEVLAGGSAAANSGNLNLTITGNTIDTPGNTAGTIGFPKNGVHFNIGTVPGDTYQVCAQVGGAGALRNTLSTSGKDAIPPTIGDIDIRLRQRQATTIRLPGYSGANNDNTAVQTFVVGNNSLGGTPVVLAANTVPTGGGFTGGAACTQP